jgi:hypothetical protein
MLSEAIHRSGVPPTRIAIRMLSEAIHRSGVSPTRIALRTVFD